MLKKLINGSSKGFTLIELLIVIVIIGILAGVLISVIDPTAQQNRARDANVKAAINKVALATQGYISAYGSAPTEVMFLGSLDNAFDSGDSNAPIHVGSYTCGNASGYSCLFSIQGNGLPTTCRPNLWQGIGNSQCFYRYQVANPATAPSDFTIYAKSFGLINTMFRYQNYDSDGTGANEASVIMHCPAGVRAGTTCTLP